MSHAVTRRNNEHMVGPKNTPKETLALLFGRPDGRGFHIVEHAVFPPQIGGTGFVEATDCRVGEDLTQYSDLLRRVLPDDASKGLVQIGTWHTHPNLCSNCPTALDWHMYLGTGYYPRWRVDYVAVLQPGGDVAECAPWRLTELGVSAVQGCIGYYSSPAATSTQHACSLNNPSFCGDRGVSDGYAEKGDHLVEHRAHRLHVWDFTRFGCDESDMAFAARATALEIQAMDSRVTGDMACKVTCARTDAAAPRVMMRCRSLTSSRLPKTTRAQTKLGTALHSLP